MNFKLTGRNAVDPTNASIRQLIDIRTGAWDKQILDVVGIDESRLPEILPSGELVGTLTKSAADDLGVPTAVKVYNGAHDQYCSSIGSGLTEPGRLLLATGTTWVAMGITEKLLYTESRLAPGIFPLTGKYGVMASMVSAGSALKWWKNIIGVDYGEMDLNAAERMNSAADLLFYPYVAGVGLLHDKNARAGVSGMTLRHDKYDMTLALMEGVSFEAKLLLNNFAEYGMDIKTLIMTGGAAKSKLWSELTGYITGCEILHPIELEAAALGALMIAAIGDGIYGGLKDCTEIMVKCNKSELSDNEKYSFYAEKFARYCRNIT
jgi:sugar (pentulose or hexulose) kinase